MSIDPVISLKSSYHKSSKNMGKALYHEFIAKVFTEKIENKLNMLPKGIIK